MVRARAAIVVGLVFSAGCGLFVGLDDKELLEEAQDAGTSDVDAAGDVRADTTSAPAPTTILSGLVRPTSVAVDVNNVYLAEESGTVKRLRKGETEPTVLAKNQATPTQLLLDTEFAYWRNTNTTKKATDLFFDSILRIEKVKDQGSNPQRLVNEESSRPSEVRGIALFEGAGDSFLYYTRDDQVRRKPRADGQDVELASNQKVPSAIVADDKFVYFVVSGDFSIRRHAKTNVGPDGGPNPPAETMFTSPDSRVTIALAVDDQALYFLTETGFVSRMEKMPGAAPKVLADSKPTGSGALALDATTIYWINGARGTVSAIAKEGATTSRILAAGRLDLSALAVDSLDVPHRVYFTTSTELQRVDLP